MKKTNKLLIMVGICLSLIDLVLLWYIQTHYVIKCAWWLKVLALMLLILFLFSCILYSPYNNYITINNDERTRAIRNLSITCFVFLMVVTLLGSVAVVLDRFVYINCFVQWEGFGLSITKIFWSNTELGQFYVDFCEEIKLRPKAGLIAENRDRFIYDTLSMSGNKPKLISLSEHSLPALKQRLTEGANFLEQKYDEEYAKELARRLKAAEFEKLNRVLHGLLPPKVPDWWIPPKR